MMRRMIKSFGYAFSGIAYTFRTQPNFKIHTLAFALVCAAGRYYRLSGEEWTSILIVSGAVFTLELINTAVEAIVDLISPAYHEKAKIAKDASAAAVLIAALTALLIGLFVFITKILA